MKDISLQIRNAAAVLATAATLLTGCHKQSEAPTPEKSAEMSRVSLPPAPTLGPDIEVMSLFRDPGLPPEVRSSLMNPRVHAILQDIWESEKRAQPFSYVRNSYPPADGVPTVIVLQHLLNVALPPTLQQGRAHHEDLLKLAATQTSPWREDTFARAKSLKSRLGPVPLLELDGDFGPRSHKRRALITQIANITSNFPHIKLDAGANDTACGPRTLRLMTESKPEFRRYFEVDFAVVALSHDEAATGDPARHQAP